MSVQSEIDRINNNVQSTLSIISDTGVEVGANSDALPAAATALANEKANVNHTQAASTITAGTFGGKVVANQSAASDVGVSQVRNIYAGTGDMNPGVTKLETGALYLVYE